MSSQGKSPRSLLNTPVMNKSPIMIRTPYLHRELYISKPLQAINKDTKAPLSPAQTASRKLIQKSVRLLNTPKVQTPVNTPARLIPPATPIPMSVPP